VSPSPNLATNGISSEEISQERENILLSISAWDESTLQNISALHSWANEWSNPA